MIEQLQQELSELQAKVRKVHSQIEELQRTCDHEFYGDSYYVKCSKCQKIEALYY
jgi:predicted RNase H-like nuclease (RuvC/YqgF family)